MKTGAWPFDADLDEAENRAGNAGPSPVSAGGILQVLGADDANGALTGLAPHPDFQPAAAEPNAAEPIAPAAAVSPATAAGFAGFPAAMLTLAGADDTAATDATDPPFDSAAVATTDVAPATEFPPPEAFVYIDEVWNAAPQDAESNALMGVNAFRADSRFAGIDGSGYSVVIIDTGINKNHSYFSGHIAYSYDFYAGNDADATDYDGHGSNVASIAAGSFGVAPGANIIALKVFSDNGGSGFYSDIEEALQWVINNGAAYNVVSVNLSLGNGLNYTTATTHSILGNEFQTLANQGVIVVGAAGNSYASYQVQGASDIAADPNVIGVGAVYDGATGGWSYGGGAIAYTTTGDQITPFSQRSTTLVDIFAPGAPITGAGASGNGTVTMHGTSQAAPQITGIAALAQELAVQTIGRKLTVAEFTSLLVTSGAWIYDGDNENDNVVNTQTYYKRADVAALGQAILAMDVATTLTGNAGNDVLTATRKSVIYGLDGNDTLVGSPDIDTLDGGNGDDLLYTVGLADTLIGGAGNDTFVVDNPNVVIIEGAGGGADTIRSSVSIGLRANVETLVLTGTDNINASGLGGNDTLVGNSGNNVLDGSAGADTMTGGGGNDTYYVDTAADVIVETAASGGATVVWRDGSNGGTVAWAMNGGALASTTPLTAPGASAGWRVAGLGDFNGDGQSDVLWRDATTGSSYIAYMNGGTVIGGGGPSLGNVPQPWIAAGVGDFNGDGRADILWRNPVSGDDIVWLMNGTTVTSYAYLSLGAVPDPWRIAGIGDFTGDGKSDVLWSNAGLGANIVWTMNGATVLNYAYLPMAGLPAPWSIAGVGDFNLDGMADILWRNATTLENQVWYMNGLTLSGIAAVAGPSGALWSVQAVATPPGQASGGNDLVVSTAGSYTLPTGVEQMILGTGATTGIGNSVANVITGNAGNNTLSGNGGDDTLYGGDGNDSLDGGAGADTMVGGAGMDTYFVDSAADVLIEDTQSARLLGVVWGNGAGSTQAWVIDGSSLVSSGALANPGAGTGWKVVGAGDFDGDQQQDLLWRDPTTGANRITFMDGVTPVSTATPSLGDVPSNWAVAGVADLDHDGKADILWRNPTNGLGIVWTMDGSTVTSVGYLSLGAVPSPWTVASTGDFNRDGAADILWRNETLGQTYVWFMNGANALGYAQIAPVGAPWTLAGTGDFNHDGGTDLLWHNTATGQNIAWLMDGAAMTTYAWLPNTPTPGSTVAGIYDFSGDGKDDILWRDAGTGQNTLWFMDGVTQTGSVTVSSPSGSAWSLQAVFAFAQAAAGDIDAVVSTAPSFALPGGVENLTLGAGAVSGTGNALGNSIVGNAANNVLDGAGGDDTLTGGGGADTMYGGSGSDKFVLANDGAPDRIMDFQPGAGGDVLDVHAVLSGLGYAGANPLADGMVRVIASGADALVQVDTQAGAGVTYTTLATLSAINPAALDASNYQFV